MPRAARAVAPRPILTIAALALLGGCGHQSAIESGLNRDLVLADQLQQRNAPPLVVARDSAPAAVASPRAAEPARDAGAPGMRSGVVTRTIVVHTPATARPAVAAGTPATAPVVAGHSGAANGGTYDPGHVSDGEIASTESSAPAARNGNASNDVGGSARSGPVYRTAQTHGERDAILGSVAGAIIGAATGHGLRGGLIGAVAGGALGAIYGGSIDRSFPGYPTYAGVQPSRGFRHDPGYRPYPGYRVPMYRTF